MEAEMKNMKREKDDDDGMKQEERVMCNKKRIMRERIGEGEREK
jgi:hypothetical protein